MVLPSQCRIQSYFEAGILVWNPKLRPPNCQKCFWCKFLSPFLVPEPQEQCFEIFRMQNSQKFPGLCTWTPLGRAYNTPSPPSPRLPPILVKKPEPPKNCWIWHCIYKIAYVYSFNTKKSRSLINMG